MQKIEEKIIWTLKELEVEFARQRQELPDLGGIPFPRATFTVNSGEVLKVSEPSQVERVL